jgi:hypothetical protein
MVRKSKIRAILLFPAAIILFFVGWRLWRVESRCSDNEDKPVRKKQQEKLQFGVLLPEEQTISEFNT